MSAPHEGGGGGASGASESQRVAVLLSWLVVAVPALWGVAQVVTKSMALFTH